MIILRAEEVKKALPMAETIEAMKSAYAALSKGQAEVPLRAHLNVAPYKGASLFMPSFVQDEGGDALTLKAVSVFPNNADLGLPVIHAAVLVLEPRTGKPLALIEGGTLTAIRTGAASGAATDLLAQRDANQVAIFGAGVQGRTQLEAICSVRNIKTAWIFDINPQKAKEFIHDCQKNAAFPQDIRLAATPKEAASQAGIICTATTSTIPVYSPDAVNPGTHINAVGSYTLDMVENPPLIFGRATPFVDSKEAVMAEAGEIVTAVKQEIITPQNLIEIGDVILGNTPGRTSKKQITFFKSVGVAVQDAMASRLALQNAERMGLGQRVAW